MANYYTHLCFKLTWPEPALHMLKQVLSAWESVVDAQEELIVDGLPEDEIIRITTPYGENIANAMKAYGDTDEIMTHGCDFHWGPELDHVVIVHDESANINPLIAIFEIVIQELLPGDGLSVFFEWGGSASRPMPDVYCGGAVFIDINGTDFTYTGNYPREREMKHMMLQVTELIDIGERRIDEITQQVGKGEPTLDLCMEIASLRNSVFTEGVRLKRFVRRFYGKPEEGSIYEG